MPRRRNNIFLNLLLIPVILTPVKVPLLCNSDVESMCTLNESSSCESTQSGWLITDIAAGLRQKPVQPVDISSQLERSVNVIEGVILSGLKPTLGWNTVEPP